MREEELERVEMSFAEVFSLELRTVRLIIWKGKNVIEKSLETQC